MARAAEDLRRDGNTVMFVAIDGRAAGLVGVADPVKDNAAEALSALRAEGVRVVMLTGDNRVTAEAVARRLGIDEVHAEVLPQRKAEVVRELQANRGAWSRWPATVSTTRPRWRRPTSESRWAPAPTSRWRARA